MKTYSVKSIADLLNTNPETVRRWIRSGKLKAIQHSRKDGNAVREEDLYKFLRSTSKYATVAAGLATGNPLLVLTTAVGVGVLGPFVSALSSEKNKSEREIHIYKDDIKQMLMKSINETKKSIERKTAALAELQAEINKEQQQIRDYEMALEHLSDAIPAVEKDEYEEVIG